MTGDSTSQCSHVKHCVREWNDCFDVLNHTRKAIVWQESFRNSQNSYSDIFYTWLKKSTNKCSTMPKVMRHLGWSCGQLYQTLPRDILYIVSHNSHRSLFISLRAWRHSGWYTVQQFQAKKGLYFMYITGTNNEWS